MRQCTGFCFRGVALGDHSDIDPAKGIYALFCAFCSIRIWDCFENWKYPVGVKSPTVCLTINRVDVVEMRL